MKVQGTQETVKPIEILGDKVLIHTNIQRVTKETEFGTEEMWEYDEERISKNEYIERLKEDNVTSMLAITELYEMLLGGQ